MPSSNIKRTAVESDLERRVRPRRESSEDVLSTTSTPSESGLGKSGKDIDWEMEKLGEEAGDSTSDDDPNAAATEAESISFGALAKAQATLNGPTKRKRQDKRSLGDTWENNEALERQAGRKDRRDFNRTNKHAPTELSSKKAVSRRREVVPVVKKKYRDPRFDPVAGSVDESKFRKAYSFLDDYREDEMKELKTAIKNTRDEDAKDKLKRALLTMESRKKTQERKDKAQEVLEKHRREEKELVRQGKKPFYLKKPDLKKRILMDQYGQLKGKQLDRFIEKRRKRVESKEKKNLPRARRAMDT